MGEFKGPYFCQTKQFACFGVAAQNAGSGPLSTDSGVSATHHRQSSSVVNQPKTDGYDPSAFIEGRPDTPVDKAHR